ncbi:hypothetical protein BKA70DRAFT_1229502 [Coprinopsis sp. MPI-PUGE-AT-0042]|nr:hypothetical protein BKA70DRAFT_1229502 [Coprinopsis sp. MPI-PUGE-AT-0042]
MHCGLDATLTSEELDRMVGTSEESAERAHAEAESAGSMTGMLEDLKEALVVYTSSVDAKDTARRHKALSEVVQAIMDVIEGSNNAEDLAQGTSSDSVVLNEIVRIVRGMDMALLFEDADGANGDGDTVGTVEHDEQVHQGFPLLLHLLAKRIDSEAKDVVLQCPPAATGTTTQEPTTATIPMLDFFDPQVPFCIGFRLFNIVKERRFVAMMAESRIVALDTLVMSAPLYRRGRDSVLVDPARAWCSPHLIRSYALDFGIGGLSYYVNQYIDRESMPIATSGRNCEPYGCSSTEASDDSKSNLRSVLVTTPGDTPHPRLIFENVTNGGFCAWNRKR